MVTSAVRAGMAAGQPSWPRASWSISSASPSPTKSGWAEGEDDALLLDVRKAPELKVEQVEGVVHIPLRQLRERLSELPKDRNMHMICRSGQRAYYATRALLQNGFTEKTCQVACCPAITEAFFRTDHRRTGALLRMRQQR